MPFLPHPARALGLAAVLIAQQPASPPASAEAGAIELPSSPAGRAFAGVSPSTVAAALPAAVARGLEDKAWQQPGTWMGWAEAVRAEADASAPHAVQRAYLAQIALAQGRWDDAWDHFAATGGEPGLCAGLLPRFLPGVAAAPQASAGDGPPTFAAALGGHVGALPEGVLLRPALPPPAVPAAQVALGRNWIERRSMRLEGLRIGAAIVAMKVSLESDGVQVEFTHQGGGAARWNVMLPEPLDFEVRVAYVDWMRQDEVGIALEVAIAPGDEPHTLFGRFRPRSIPWPTNLPPATPRFLSDHGLELCFPADAPDAAVFRSAGPALARVLGLPVVSGTPAGAEFAGVRIELGDPALARRKFQGLITLVERFALR